MGGRPASSFHVLEKKSPADIGSRSLRRGRFKTALGGHIVQCSGCVAIRVREKSFTDAAARLTTGQSELVPCAVERSSRETSRMFRSYRLFLLSILLT